MEGSVQVICTRVSVKWVAETLLEPHNAGLEVTDSLYYELLRLQFLGRMHRRRPSQLLQCVAAMQSSDGSHIWRSAFPSRVHRFRLIPIPPRPAQVAVQNAAWLFKSSGYIPMREYVSVNASMQTLVSSPFD